MSAILKVRAHAKINVSLRVCGLRPDGYHELRTVFQSIALHDTVFVRRARGPVVVTTTDPSVPEGRDNLTWRALEMVWRIARRPAAPAGLRIHLVKRIPAGGGLGGGSSDAAAVIRAMIKLWRVRLDAEAIRAIARELGADVPFFLRGGTALGLDRGDAIFDLPDLPRHWIVLAMPDFSVSTVAAFGWFDAQSRPDVDVQRIPGVNGPVGEVRNDLEAVVASHYPQIAEIKCSLLRSRAIAAAMTGSGSTVFGLFTTQSAATRAALQLGRDGVTALVSQFISRTVFARAAEPIAVRSLPGAASIG
jgi:4-diphosphocytidyl-2-C-methyl-D-erythritol kinase